MKIKKNITFVAFMAFLNKNYSTASFSACVMNNSPYTWEFTSPDELNYYYTLPDSNHAVSPGQKQCASQYSSSEVHFKFYICNNTDAEIFEEGKSYKNCDIYTNTMFVDINGQSGQVIVTPLQSSSLSSFTYFVQGKQTEDTFNALTRFMLFNISCVTLNTSCASTLSLEPINTPTAAPTTQRPTGPTAQPTKMPTKIPTKMPTKAPTKRPTLIPIPLLKPTSSPATFFKTYIPTQKLTRAPSAHPTAAQNQAGYAYFFNKYAPEIAIMITGSFILGSVFYYAIRLYIDRMNALTQQRGRRTGGAEAPEQNNQHRNFQLIINPPIVFQNPYRQERPQQDLNENMENISSDGSSSASSWTVSEKYLSFNP